jgi:hypothetical protein
MRHFHYLVIGVFLALSCFVSVAGADTFGSGDNSFEIEFVTIGDPGNVADTTGDPNPAGSVTYNYRIGKYEISEQMIDKANALGNLGITKDTRGPDKPATRVSWFEAAQFVNWLNTSMGHTPAYKFDGNGEFQLWTPDDTGYDANNLFRNSEAKYFLPSADEWYKAAYYDPATGTWYDYPTGSNTAPTSVASGIDPGTAVYRQDLSAGPADVFNAGGLSPYGTMAQGGNVEEWEETELDLFNNNALASRGRRGGFWEFSAISAPFRNANSPSVSVFGVGFRVASMPEPDALLLIAGGAFGVLGLRRWIRVER